MLEHPTETRHDLDPSKSRPLTPSPERHLRDRLAGLECIRCMIGVPVAAFRALLAVGEFKLQSGDAVVVCPDVDGPYEVFGDGGDFAEWAAAVAACAAGVVVFLLLQMILFLGPKRHRARGSSCNITHRGSKPYEAQLVDIGSVAAMDADEQARAEVALRVRLSVRRYHAVLEDFARAGVHPDPAEAHPLAVPELPQVELFDAFAELERIACAMVHLRLP